MKAGKSKNEMKCTGYIRKKRSGKKWKEKGERRQKDGECKQRNRLKQKGDSLGKEKEREKDANTIGIPH